MIEVAGNLWEFPADVRVITTNGTVKKNGECVMGRGCAAEARQRDATFPALLGHHIKINGNRVGMIGVIGGLPILSFPVKHEWFQKADLDLIQRSALSLAIWAGHAAKDGPLTVVLPRPGCGNGGLHWCNCMELEASGARDRTDGGHCYGIKHVLAPILDDRFHVITFGR